MHTKLNLKTWCLCTCEGGQSCHVMSACFNVNCDSALVSCDRSARQRKT